jgi:hypoxia up-regulated 1
MAPRSGRPLAPLGALLLAIFLLASQTLAASAALGIDFGTEYIKAALVKPGTPIDIVLTKDSRRKELATIAFKPAGSSPQTGAYPERVYGSDAAALAARFPADVYPNLKTLLGAVVEDAVVQEYAARHPALKLQSLDGRQTAAFKSGAFSADFEPWSVEELLAMQLQSIQKNAELEAGSGFTVRSAVITVPPFYTTEEKRAVHMAAELAGFRVLSLISDGLAVGLQYATTRQFPNIHEGGKPEHHLVFDMGAGSTKATIMKFQSKSVKDVGRFNKTVQEIAVLGAAWDRTLGGDAFNSLIVDDMLAQFVDSKGAKAASVTPEGVKSHGRAVAKLSKEAERLRQILSANADTQGSFEGLYEDVDFKYKITRADFEGMTKAHADRVAEVVKNALKAAQLEVIDLSSVILHGGASRTPFVQKALEGVIGAADKIRSNVNSDEAAVLGAGFRAAKLSPGFRVKDIHASEGTGYASGIRWVGPNGKEQHQRLWTAVSPVGGPTKEVTFANTEDFSITFFQTVDGQDRDVKTLITKNLTATVAELKDKHACPEGVAVKIGVKLQDKDGEVTIAKVTAECEIETKDGLIDGVKNLFGFGKKEQAPLNEDKPAEASSPESSATSAGESADASQASSAAPAEESVKPAPSKQVIIIPVQHELESASVPQLSKDARKAIQDRLKAFDKSDRDRRAREEALNLLEAYTYRVREMLDNDGFVAAAKKQERADLDAKSSDAGDWIYGDGADAPKDEFTKRLNELKAIAEPIQARIRETAERPGAIKGVKDAITQVDFFVKTMLEQLQEYEAWESSSSASAAAAATESPQPIVDEFADLEDTDPLEPPVGSVEEMIKEQGPAPPLYSREDIETLQKARDEASQWLGEKGAEQTALGPTDDPVILVNDLRARKEDLEKLALDTAMAGMRGFESKAKKIAKDQEAKQKGGGRKTKPTVTPRGKATKPGKASKQEETPAAGEAREEEQPQPGVEGEDAKAEEKVEEKVVEEKVEKAKGESGPPPSKEEEKEYLEKDEL